MLPGKVYGPADVLDAISRRRWWIIAPAWAIWLTTLALVARMPDRYEASVRVRLIPPKVTDGNIGAAVPANLGDRLAPVTSQVLNATRLQAIVTRFGLYTPEQQESGANLADIFRRDLRIQLFPPDAIRLAYTANDAKTALAVTEEVGQAFIQENLRQTRELVNATATFVDEQLDDARHRLEAQEHQLEDYRRAHEGELPTQLESNLQLMQAVQTRLQALREGLGRDRDELSVVERSLADAEAALGTGPDHQDTDNEPLAVAVPETAAQVALRVATADLASLTLRLTPNHPDVRRQQRRVAELTAQVTAEAASAAPPAAVVRPPAPSTVTALRGRAAELRARRSRLTDTIRRATEQAADLEHQIDTYRQRIEATPTRETELTALTRDYGTLQEVYTKLLLKREDAQLAARGDGDQQVGDRFEILEPARLPDRPVGRNRIQFSLLGIAGGLLAGFGLAALVEYRDRSLRSSDDILVSLHLPVLGVIPDLDAPGARARQRGSRIVTGALVASGAVVTFAVAYLVLR